MLRVRASSRYISVTEVGEPGTLECGHSTRRHRPELELVVESSVLCDTTQQKAVSACAIVKRFLSILDVSVTKENEIEGKSVPLPSHEPKNAGNSGPNLRIPFSVTRAMSCGAPNIVNGVSKRTEFKLK